MLRRLTPEDALLARRCNRLFLEKTSSPPASVREDLFYCETRRFKELALSRFRGEKLFVLCADEEDALEETARLLEADNPPANLISAAFAAEAWLARPDLLRYSGKQHGWELYLMRPATGIRGSYMDEAAMERLILEEAGLPIVAVRLLFLDKSYRRGEKLDPEALIKESDLTRRTEKRRPQARKLLEEATDLASGARSVDPEYRCEAPGRCSVCRRELEDLPKHNVLTLVRGGREARQLYMEGIESILDIPEEVDLTWRQTIQLRSVRTGRLQVNRERLQRFLSRLHHPRVYLDFEAFNAAIPPVTGVGPWEHVPFLFSIHRQERPGEQLSNHTFMMRPGRDERLGMFRSLVQLCEDAGSVIVFSAAFEASMIRQLAGLAGEKERGEALIGGIVDLLEPFNDFVVYHPEQLGKVSMKRIVPIFTEESYEDLEVQDGLEANLAYGELFFREEREAEPVLRRLEEYCIQDTSGMVRLVERLESLREPA
ncbi:MAG: DUF2779 domain-containing protein [Alkalispirochaetaceae bacterium]